MTDYSTLATIVELIAGIVTIATAFGPLVSARNKRNQRLPLYAKKARLMTKAETNAEEKIRLPMALTIPRELFANNLSVTKAHFAFWNGGKDPIDYGDVSPRDKIGITVNGTVLQSEVIESVPTTNRVDVEQVNNKLELTFDFLNEGNGTVIEVFYFGKPEDSTFHGRIRGTTNPKEVEVIPSEGAGFFWDRRLYNALNFVWSFGCSSVPYFIVGLPGPNSSWLYFP